MKLLLCIALLFAAAGVSADTITIKGSTTELPMLQSIGKSFAEEHAKSAVNVTGGGSGSGIEALFSGKADIASSSRFLTQDEIHNAAARDVYPIPFRIAYDGIVPIVNRRNPVRSLSTLELKAIYSGEISNWQKLGGPDLPIAVISRDFNSGTHEVWNQKVMHDVPVKTAQPLMSSNHAVITQVQNNPAAIGYISLAYLDSRVKPLAVNGVMGSMGNIKNGHYLLSRPLFLFTNQWPKGQLQAFIDYVLDPHQGQRQIERTGYIPLY